MRSASGARARGGRRGGPGRAVLEGGRRSQHRRTLTARQERAVSERRLRVPRVVQVRLTLEGIILMRQVYMVTYDISDPKRLRKVFKLMQGYGEHLQLSVFRCELNPRELLELKARLSDRIHHTEDQVLFVDVGPTEGHGSTCVTALGRAYIDPRRHAIVA